MEFNKCLKDLNIKIIPVEKKKKKDGKQFNNGYYSLFPITEHPAEIA